MKSISFHLILIYFICSKHKLEYGAATKMRNSNMLGVLTTQIVEIVMKIGSSDNSSIAVP